MDEKRRMPDASLPEEGLPEDLGGTFITLTDEDGEEHELEYLDTLEYAGNVYMAFFHTIPEGVDPASVEDDEAFGLILLRVVNVDGEDQLETIDDEDELNAVYQLYEESIFEEDDEDGDDGFA